MNLWMARMISGKIFNLRALGEQDRGQEIFNLPALADRTPALAERNAPLLPVIWAQEPAHGDGTEKTFAGTSEITSRSAGFKSALNNT